MDKTKMINFSQLTLPSKPHYCLVYNKQLPGSAERQIKAPIFNENVSTLEQQWFAFIKTQPRVKLLQENLETKHFQYVQRSKIFRFPDIIDVQFVSLANNKSSLYMFSRSVYGYSDLGVNCKRLKHWLGFANDGK